MEHLRTVYHFTETKLIKSRKKNVVPVEKTRTARIEYSYIERPPHKNDNNYYYRLSHNILIAHVYIDDELIHVFERLPHTRTNNPSKSQAKEILSKAIKEAKLPQKKTRTVLIEKTKKL